LRSTCEFPSAAREVSAVSNANMQYVFNINPVA
jgi:hypothetical protein